MGFLDLLSGIDYVADAIRRRPEDSAVNHIRKVLCRLAWPFLFLAAVVLAAVFVLTVGENRPTWNPWGVGGSALALFGLAGWLYSMGRG